MDWKDYLIIGGALFLLFGGGVGLHFYTKGKGNVPSGPTGGAIVDDPRRMGVAITTTGGKAFAEGGKLIREGASRYIATRQLKEMQLVGGA